jgi:thiol-disulfide isomerase/thioredoxin
MGRGRGEAGSKISSFGDRFPEYTFDAPGASEDRAYLGISDKRTFAVADIQADLIVVEVLNTYCTSCQMQAPIYNQVFELTENDPTTKGRVKWLGVGVGNNAREIASFRGKKAVSFPILTDLNFEFYDALGGPGGVRTPLTVLVRKDDKGRGIVVDSHIGYRKDEAEIFEGIKAALLYDLAYLKIKEGERAVLPVTKKLPLPISEGELLQKIKDGMAMAGGSVVEVRKLQLNDEVVYLGNVRIDSRETQLFARVVGRPPVCDICHDIHFVYIFDQGGEVTNFVPIHLTKYGNRPWDDHDIEQMKSRIVGRSLLKPLEFDRDLDAVSRATITSVVIFDGINKGRDAHADLIKGDYLK